jgi:hypothetical protein
MAAAEMIRPLDASPGRGSDDTDRCDSAYTSAVVTG